MSDPPAEAEKAAERPRNSSQTEQLASPPLSPIAEHEIPSIEPLSSNTPLRQDRPNGHAVPKILSLPDSGKISPGNGIISSDNQINEAVRGVTPSPKNVNGNFSTPSSLPLRTLNVSQEGILPLSDGLGRPVTAPSTWTTLVSPPPLDSYDNLQTSGDDSSTFPSPLPSPLLIHSVPAGATPTTVIRPRQGVIRSATSPLLKRRESANAPRLPKTPSGEGLRMRKPSLTRLKTGDEIKQEIPGSSKTQSSPILASVPLPPLSLSTYLQLELSSDRPSALYIQRPVASDLPYEPSSVKFERLLNFLYLPHQLEQILWFGTLACLDAWLYSLTILPLRFLKALFLAISYGLSSLSNEITTLSRFVAAGLKRVWHRKRRGSVANIGLDDRTGRSANPPLPQTPLANPVTGRDSSRRRQPSAPGTRGAYKERPMGLSPNNKADLLHGFLIIISCLILNRFDASRMYHSIRGQAAIKLYVIYNVLEVCDRLFSALGQDILECLFSNETLDRKPNGRSRVIRPIWMFILALIYNVIHATMLFYQVVTLNVAVNSYSNALLTLLMSNQFVEIKGTVFKKFEKESLFQLTCADVVERFQLWLMLTIIASRNIVEVGGLSNLPSNPSQPPPNSTTGGPATSSLLPAAFSLLPSLTTPVLAPFLIVLGSEMLVDWLKHAYINKFNAIAPSLYGRFLDVLAKDYYTHAFADQNLTKRIGLPTLPLACLVLRAAVQVWGMFAATTLSAAPPVPSIVGGEGLASPGTTAALVRIDALFRHALGRSAFISPQAGEGGWSTDDVLALLTIVVLVLLVYLFLLAFKLVLGMALLAFARQRYRGMREREREGHEILSRRIGGWGVTEVDDEKRRVIYEGDEEGLRRVKEREGRERKTMRLEGVGRYMMAGKRIW